MAFGPGGISRGAISSGPINAGLQVSAPAPTPQVVLGDADYLLLSELLAQQARGRRLSAKEQRQRWQEVNDAVSRFEERERATRQTYQEVTQAEPTKAPEIPVKLPEYKPKPKTVDLQAAKERIEAHQARIQWLENEIQRVQREIEDEEDDDEILWLLAA